MSRLDDPSLPVTLNVGGQLFTTTLQLLRLHSESALAALFRHPVSCPRDPRDGSYFLDRNGQTFAAVLDYLRTGTLTVPRDPVGYSLLRREVVYFGLPVAQQLPPIAPPLWQSAPKRYRHARIVVDELEKQVEWEEGVLPNDLQRRTVLEIVSFFGAQGYRVASEYVSRGSTGYTSVWLVKEETYPGADVPLEVRDLGTSTSNQSVMAPVPAAAVSMGMVGSPYSGGGGGGGSGLGGGGGVMRSTSNPYLTGGPINMPSSTLMMSQPSYGQTAPEGLRNIPTYNVPPR